MAITRPHRTTISASVLAVLATATTVSTLGTGVAGAAECTALQVVSARGTNEPGGAWSTFRLGTVVGNPVYSAIADKLGATTDAYRVDYPADLNQPRSVKAGNRDLVEHVVAQAAACPRQRFVLVGYSQGANVVDNSIGVSSEGAKVGGPIVATLPDRLAPRIVAVLLFGNPIRELGRSVTGTYADRTYDVCNANDPVCDPDGSDWNVHLRYARYADAAAEFVDARM
ncbi:cutinase family protein [Nocardia sp. NPDC048505]|uniref:cutinase family protein n=1 Tax=Nocardia sp. NPDC048505 TaxID=3155756 RepID=UPI0033D02645